MPLAYCWGAEFESAHQLAVIGAAGFFTGYNHTLTDRSTYHHGSGTGTGDYSQRGNNYYGCSFNSVISIPQNPGYWISWARSGQSGSGSPMIYPFGPVQYFKVFPSGNQIQIKWYNGSSDTVKATSSYSMATNTFEDIACLFKYDGTDYTIDVYVGGTLFVSATQASSITFGNTTGFNIIQQGGQYWYVDDIRVFDDPIADAQSAKAPGYVFGGHVSADSIDGSFVASTGPTDPLFPCVTTGPPPDWTKSISTTTDGDICRFDMDNIGGAISGTPDGVVVHCIADTDSGMDDITIGIAESSVAAVVYGTTTDCQVIRGISNVFLTSDGSTPWTQASFDAAVVVIKATS